MGIISASPYYCTSKYLEKHSNYSSQVMAWNGYCHVYQYWRFGHCCIPPATIKHVHVCLWLWNVVSFCPECLLVFVLFLVCTLFSLHILWSFQDNVGMELFLKQHKGAHVKHKTWFSQRCSDKWASLVHLWSYSPSSPSLSSSWV